MNSMSTIFKKEGDFSLKGLNEVIDNFAPLSYSKIILSRNNYRKMKKLAIPGKEGEFLVLPDDALRDNEYKFN